MPNWPWGFVGGFGLNLREGLRILADLQPLLLPARGASFPHPVIAPYLGGAPGGTGCAVLLLHAKKLQKKEENVPHYNMHPNQSCI